MKPREMMGFEAPLDQKVLVPVRNWNAMRLAIWRSKVAWEIAARAALEITDGCSHAKGCSGEDGELEPCLPECPDRERRMSALVILNAARMFAPADARHPANAPYSAPSREYFSEVLSDLAAAQIQLEALRAMGVQMPEPPPNGALELPKRSLDRILPGEFDETETKTTEESA